MQTNDLPSIESSSNEHDPNTNNPPATPSAAAVTPPSYFTATTDEASQKQLATDMGYPSGWHVVRIVPHPADRFLYDMRHSGESKAFVQMVQGGDDDDLNAESSHGPQNVMMIGSEFRYTCPWSMEDGPVVDWMCSSYEDKIYSGVPGSGCDMYYNHEAAMQVALKWIPGTSTEFDDKGGHMLPREPLFKEDDFVEVLYEEENQWYYAKVAKVKEYLNDVRYTVFFPDEEATQDNISEENMRRTEKRSAKKKKKKKRSPKKDSSAKKSGGVALMELPMPGKKRKGPTSRLSAKEKKERSKIAKKMGLPEGWLALMGNNYTVRIWNPDGDFFSSKKKAFESMGLVESESSSEEMEQTGKRPRKAKSKKKEKRRHSRRSLCHDKKNYTETDLEVLNDPADLIPYSPPGQKNDIDEEDPPWRRSGNALVGRTIEYSFRSEKNRRTTVIGLITGWLDETDLDSEGNPAYIGEKSKKPEKLFHVEFDETAELWFIDLEEYEVLDMLVPEEQK